eukprot:Skav222468  [mRNA]  locus=scaffold2163:159121:159294:- [translate_table: standard]
MFYQLLRSAGLDPGQDMMAGIESAREVALESAMAAVILGGVLVVFVVVTVMLCHGRH